MKLYLELSHDEIQREIPYMIVAETMCRSVWNTGRRKRMFVQQFTEAEHDRIYKMKSQAYAWALVRGVPLKGVKMTIETYRLWHRLADFCASL